MAHEKAPVEEKMQFGESIGAEVNQPPRSLREHLGVTEVAVACHACGLFHGLESDLGTDEKNRPSCSGTSEEPHEPVLTDRYDFNTVEAVKRGGRYYLVKGNKVAAAEDPAELQKQIEGLQARKRAAEAAAAKKG